MSPTDYDLPAEVAATRDGPVVVLVLNRPDQLNAANPALHGAMASVWRRIAADPEARCVVLTGAGRAFCAGGDLDMLEGMHADPVFRGALLLEGLEIIREMVAFRLPVVAAVNGPAVGFGCSLALLSDLVLMADDAYMADPHVSIGVVAADGGAAVWPLMMSLLRAKEFILTGDRINAANAVQLGMANRVVPAPELMEAALSLAHRLSAMPAGAVQDSKRLLNTHLERAVQPGLAFGFAAEGESFATPEFGDLIARLRNRSRSDARG